MICLGLGFFLLSPREYLSETTLFVPFTALGTKMALSSLSKFNLKMIFLQRSDVLLPWRVGILLFH